MNYSQEFKESALKEWHKLDESIREQFKKRLAERLHEPHIIHPPRVIRRARRYNC